MGTLSLITIILLIAKLALNTDIGWFTVFLPMLIGVVINVVIVLVAYKKIK